MQMHKGLPYFNYKYIIKLLQDLFNIKLNISAKFHLVNLKLGLSSYRASQRRLLAPFCSAFRVSHFDCRNMFQRTNDLTFVRA